MGIRRSMTGVSWHIEKTGGYSKTRVNCFNCIYLNGHWCEKNRIQVTNNNAPVCKSYKNMYVTKKDCNEKCEKKVEPKVKVVKVSRKESNVKNKSVRPNIPTTLIIKINKTLFDKINEKITLDGSYVFKGFVELEKTDSTVFDKDINVILLATDQKEYMCILKKKSLQMIKSGKIMTLYFVIVKINENKGLFHYEKSVEVVRGVDNIYGQISFYRSKKIYNKFLEYRKA